MAASDLLLPLEDSKNFIFLRKCLNCREARFHKFRQFDLATIFLGENKALQEFEIFNLT